MSVRLGALAALVAVALCGPAGAATDHPFDYRKLSLAAGALRSVVDAGLDDPRSNPGESVLGCAISSAQARAWLSPLQALIDGRLPDARAAYGRDPRSFSAAIANCKAQCLCGAYADLLTDPDPTRLTATDPRQVATLARLRREASALGEKQAMACAQKQKWFCRSRLKRDLVAAAAGDSATAR